MFYGTKEQAIAMIESRFNAGDIVAFQVWQPADVRDEMARRGRVVGEEIAAKVLEAVAAAHDCNHGVSWDTLADTAGEFDDE